MKIEIVKALLELIDDNYGINLDSGVTVTYVGQGMYDIKIHDRDKLVDLVEINENH